MYRRNKLFLCCFFCSWYLLSGLTGISQAPGNAPATWTIVASYTIPGKASGLAWDGSYIYFGIYGANGDQVYKFNPANGTYTLQCNGAFDDAYGMTYKSPDLVTIDQPSSSANPATALEFTMSGATVTTLTLPDHYMSGIAYDAGNWWVCTYYPDPGTVYKLSPSGAVLSQFTPPANQPWDICLQGSDLWIADYYANNLYKVTTSGTVLETHPSQNLKPSGIVYDGTYLWYCDGELGSNSTLYKVDLAGAGTPAISVPVTAHDYGAVQIGNSSTWNCQVQNTGNANLTITSIGISPGDPVSTTFTTPQTITPGGSVNVPLMYTPVAPIPLNTQVYINSNDPIHPSVGVTLTGNGVYAGPHIVLGASSYDWGERRAGAYSRLFLSLTNDGSQALTITALTMSDPHFIVDESVTLPMNVPTLQTVYIGLWFHPEEGIPYTGILTITSNAVGQTTLDVTLEGSGVEAQYPVGAPLWNYMITGSYDNSVKAITPIQDITGDGVDDVIVASEDDHIRCFNGNASVTGDVLWETEIYAGAVYNQNSLVTIEDINNDGYRDVIVGTAWGDQSIVALSGKTGSQLWKHDTHEYGDGGWVYQVDARYDYNNDGFPDVLAATGDDGNDTGPLRVYCLNGKTGLSIWENPANGPVFSVIGVEDFTGDNKPDVVAGASNMQETQGKVIGINGANGATFWTYISNGTSVWGLMQLDDINNDGVPDIASGDYAGWIDFLNAVNGSKLDYFNIGNVLILRLQNMGDVNDDSHPDILVAHSGLTAHMINGFTCSDIWSLPLADKSWNVANIGDITFDGRNDAIIGTLYQDNYIYFLHGPDGDVLFSSPVNTPVDAINAIPDIVGDTTMEMVIGGRSGLVLCLSGGYDTTTTGIRFSGPEKKIRITVYPNPSSGKITLDIYTNEACQAEFGILDITGNYRFRSSSHRLLQGTNKIETDLRSSCSPGIYLLEVNAGDDKAREKLIIF